MLSVNSGPNLPAAFVDRLRQDLDAERSERVLAGMSSYRVTGFRVNRLRSGEEDPFSDLRDEGVDVNRVTFLDEAAWVLPDYRQKLLFSSAYVGKRIYVQNLASMLPVLALAPEPGHRILDLAAAPGSKTLQIAGMAGPETEIAAVEVSRSRFFRMKSNLEDFGAGFVRTFLRDGSTVWRVRGEYFDRVLLDAPCSSEGRFLADDPESYRYWSPRKTSEMARKQKRLLFSAIQSLRPGGVLVYSTCALSVEENERVVSDMLTRFGEALATEEPGPDVDETDDPVTEWRGNRFDDRVSAARRIVPSERMEGFFICRFRKTRSTLD